MLSLTKSEKKILLAVLSILLGLCTLAYFAHHNSQRLIISSEKIEQSEEIKFHIKEILSISVDMETGVRGYVVTGDESYMEPSNKAIADIYLHLHELITSPGIAEGQLSYIAQLDSLLDKKSNLATRTIELRRQKGMNEAIAFIGEGKEKELMNQIRVITNKMLSDEDARLGELKVENRSAIKHFALTFYFLLLKIAITVITSVTLLYLYFKSRHKTERILKQSQELFHNVLDHTASIISIKDLSGRYLLINKAYENMLGRTWDEVKGKTAYDLYEKDVAENIRNTDLEVIRLQQQIKTEEMAPYKGEMRHYFSLKFPLFDYNRIPYAVCSISTDETERMQTEWQHKEQMDRMLDLFNNAPCGYQATDKDGIIIEINETLLKWLGYTRDEVVGKLPVRNIISKESQQTFSYYFPRIRSGEIKSVFDVEVNYVRKDGSKLSVVANSMAQYDEEGNFQYTRTSVFDISYRKRVEEISAHN